MKKFFSIKNKYFVAFVVLIIINFVWSDIWVGNILVNRWFYFGPEEPLSQIMDVLFGCSTRITLFLGPFVKLGILGTGLKILYDILKKLDLS